MRNLFVALLLLVLVLLPAACVPIPTPTSKNASLAAAAQLTPSVTAAPSLVAAAVTDCDPTFADPPSPTFKPDMPVRSSVGHGHVVTGVVRSSKGCAPIPNARVEFWPEINGAHPDAQRATVYTDENGRYRFECDPTDHVHMRISAPEYRAIFTNQYHSEGRAEGTFDIVLVPDTSGAATK